MARHPGHLGVAPLSDTSFFKIFHDLTLGSGGGGCSANAGSFRSLAGAENFLANAGILRPDAVGTGIAGVPPISSSNACDHLSLRGLRLTVDTRNTPAGVATKSSPVRILKPTYTPSSHLDSNFPGMNLVSGNRNHTASPNSLSLALDLRPFII